MKLEKNIDVEEARKLKYTDCQTGESYSALLFSWRAVRLVELICLCFAVGTYFDRSILQRASIILIGDIYVESKLGYLFIRMRHPLSNYSTWFRCLVDLTNWHVWISPSREEKREVYRNFPVLFNLFSTAIPSGMSDRRANQNRTVAMMAKLIPEIR